MSGKKEDRAETENLASYDTSGDLFPHINYHHMGIERDELWSVGSKSREMTKIHLALTAGPIHCSPSSLSPYIHSTCSQVRKLQERVIYWKMESMQEWYSSEVLEYKHIYALCWIPEYDYASSD